MTVPEGTNMKYHTRTWQLVLRRYWFEWVCTILVGLVTVIMSAVAHPSWRYVPTNSTDYNYPLMTETIPMSLCVVIGIIPFVLVIIIQAWYYYFVKKFEFLVDAHMLILAFAQTVAVTQLFTTFFKYYVGRVRPSGMAMQAANMTDWNESYVSGHSSFAFSSFTFIALFAAGKLGIYGMDGFMSATDSSFASPFPFFVFFMVLPLLAASFIAASRVVDYRHDFSDINAGSAIGFIGAIAIYFLHYPPLTSSRSHESNFAILLQQARTKSHRSDGEFELPLSRNQLRNDENV